MTRQAHDQFAKQYLAELLAPIGEVETSRDVSSEVRQVDVSFVPKQSPSIELQHLGLLGKMASSACLLEPFRNVPSAVEVRNCLLKLYSLHGELLRKARRERKTLMDADLPSLWILSPSCSPSLLNGFGSKLADTGWMNGVYFLPELQKTALLAINQLPTVEETLWLRLLGRDATQRQAVNELVALPQRYPFRRNVLELLANWRINLTVGENLSNDNQELIMDLSPAYLRWREEAVEEGKQEGKKEGKQQMIENLMIVRFGSLDEELSKAIAFLLQLPSEELSRVLLTLSREELLERFGG